MAKYSQKKVAECEAFIAAHGLINFGGAKLKDYCEQMDIDEKTHRNWKQRYPEYVAALERGEEAFKAGHTRKLFGTLMESALGYDKELVDEHTEYRPNANDPTRPVIRKQIRNKKQVHVQPNVVAGIFLLCNIDPEHFLNRHRNDVTVKKQTDPDEEMSPEALDKELERLEKLQDK